MQEHSSEDFEISGGSDDVLMDILVGVTEGSDCGDSLYGLACETDDTSDAGGFTDSGCHCA